MHLVGYLYYWQMGFNSVFKGLKTQVTQHGNVECLHYYALSVMDFGLSCIQYTQFLPKFGNKIRLFCIYRYMHHSTGATHGVP